MLILCKGSDWGWSKRWMQRKRTCLNESINTFKYVKVSLCWCSWRERERFFCHTDGEKEVRGGGREALALQMVCPLHPNNKHTNRCWFPLPVWITLRLYHPQQFHKQTPPHPLFFLALSQWGEVTSSSSDLNPTLPEMLLWTVWRSCYVSLHGLFLAPQHGKQREKKRREKKWCE